MRPKIGGAGGRDNRQPGGRTVTGAPGASSSVAAALAPLAAISARALALAYHTRPPGVVSLKVRRDKETIEIAVKAALTGHLVLSTLHTNDAPSTITRMVDMGLDPFMVASSTLMIAAQRLVKRLCSQCKEPIEIPIERLLPLGLLESDFKGMKIETFKAVGCGKCNGGYKGRFALLETLKLTEPVKRMINKSATVQDLKNYAVHQEGMITLRRAGMLNAVRGVTSIEEVLRSTMADEI